MIIQNTLSQWIPTPIMANFAVIKSAKSQYFLCISGFSAMFHSVWTLHELFSTAKQLNREMSNKIYIASHYRLQNAVSESHYIHGAIYTSSKYD